MRKRHLILGLVLGIGISPFTFAYESDVEIGISAGFSDNIAHAADSSKIGSLFGRSTFDLSLDWGAEESNAAPRLGLGIENDSYPDSGIAGNLSFAVEPGFRFFLLNRALASTVHYRFSRATSYLFATKKGRGGTLSSGPDFTTEAFTGNVLGWKSEYSWDDFRASVALATGSRRYTETVRTDKVSDFEVVAGISPSDAADLTVGLGLENTTSDLAGYAFSGPHLYAMGIFPAGKSLIFTLLVRSTQRNYESAVSLPAREDRSLHLEAGVEFELTPATSLEFAIGRTSAFSTIATYSFSAMESSAGFNFRF